MEKEEVFSNLKKIWYLTRSQGSNGNSKASIKFNGFCRNYRINSKKSYIQSLNSFIN